MPLTADQPMNAARAEQLGVAVVIGPTERDAATISAALERVLGDPSYAARSQRAPGGARVAPARQRRPSPPHGSPRGC